MFLFRLVFISIIILYNIQQYYNIIQYLKLKYNKVYKASFLLISMPKKVSELEDSNLFLRGKLIEFLKKNSNFAYTLRELHEIFLKEDSKLDCKYKGSPKKLYHLIYGYLRDFKLKNKVIKKGNYYYFKR